MIQSNTLEISMILLKLYFNPRIRFKIYLAISASIHQRRKRRRPNQTIFTCFWILPWKILMSIKKKLRRVKVLISESKKLWCSLFPASSTKSILKKTWKQTWRTCFPTTFCQSWQTLSHSWNFEPVTSTESKATSSSRTATTSRALWKASTTACLMTSLCLSSSTPLAHLKRSSLGTWRLKT